ncbi:hypothetical protein EDD22DRAFT_846222 [Suillus occidentalis]|nr:hypothetical protein EDD22DRAFT_846222 [Suillus occidentalis]
MCWETEAEAVPLVETSTDTSLTEPKYSGQSFEMCWDIEPESAPTVTALVTALVTAPTKASLAKADFDIAAFDLCWDTDATVDTGQYDLCWDEPNSSKVASVPVINVLVATPLATTADNYCGEEEHISSQADQYDMCWDNRPAALAAEFQGGFDMCWEDSPAVGDDDHEGHPTDAHGTSMVKLGCCIITLTIIVKMVMTIQHMLQIFRQIDDPLTILELSMKKEMD